MITEGILNINKPQNMTSHDVVSVMRRTLGIKKIGHTGTLDPMATGVLPICIGRSTRIMDYLDLDMKQYRCTMVLGVVTDTQDVWGQTLERFDTSQVDEEKVRAAFAGFHGVIDQKPPMYSALKVNGKKLYEYARAGIEVEVKTRKIFIKSLEIEEINLSAEEKTVTFTVECSKGTYIRTICQDAGDFLGCGGTLKSLVRTRSGIFDIASAIDLESLKGWSLEKIELRLQQTFEPLVHFGKVVADQIAAVQFASGWHLPLDKCEIVKRPEYEDGSFCLPMREEYKKAYNVFGRIEGKEVFLGVAFYDDNDKKLVADKVFYVR